jgi:hypothetical protein
MQLCLLAAGATIRVGTIALTLAWTHSIEKTRWEEDWRATPAGLVLEEDRIQATGAGMEPPAGAQFDGRWWHYKPKLAPLQNVILRRSGATADWTVCIAGTCQPMRDYLPADADPVTLTTCP